jgi:hypothetical protein
MGVKRGPTWSTQHTLLAFESRVLRKILEPKAEDVNKASRQLWLDNTIGPTDLELDLWLQNRHGEKHHVIKRDFILPQHRSYHFYFV